MGDPISDKPDEVATADTPAGKPTAAKVYGGAPEDALMLVGKYAWAPTKRTGHEPEMPSGDGLGGGGDGTTGAGGEGEGLGGGGDDTTGACGEGDGLGGGGEATPGAGGEGDGLGGGDNDGLGGGGGGELGGGGGLHDAGGSDAADAPTSMEIDATAPPVSE